MELPGSSPENPLASRNTSPCSHCITATLFPLDNRACQTAVLVMTPLLLPVGSFVPGAQMVSDNLKFQVNGTN